MADLYQQMQQLSRDVRALQQKSNSPTARGGSSAAKGMRPGELITRLQVGTTAAELFKALEYIEVTRLNIFNPGSDERTFKVYHSLADTPSWTDTETIRFGTLAAGGSVCLWAEEAPLLLRQGGISRHERVRYA